MQINRFMRTPPDCTFKNFNMYLENANYLQNVFKGVSLLLEAERGDSVFQQRYKICLND